MMPGHNGLPGGTKRKVNKLLQCTGGAYSTDQVEGLDQWVALGLNCLLCRQLLFQNNNFHSRRVCWLRRCVGRRYICFRLFDNRADISP